MIREWCSYTDSPHTLYIRGPGAPAPPGDWPRRSISGTVSVGVQPRLSLHTKWNGCERVSIRTPLAECNQAHYSSRIIHVYMTAGGLSRIFADWSPLAECRHVDISSRSRISQIQLIALCQMQASPLIHPQKPLL